MNIKNLRLQNNLSQQQLANILNIKQNTLSNYENGITQPDLDLIVKISDYFGCSIDYLLGHRLNETETQQNLIAIIRTLDDDLCSLAEAYIEGLKTTQKQRDMVRARVSQQNNNIEEDID